MSVDYPAANIGASRSTGAPSSTGDWVMLIIGKVLSFADTGQGLCGFRDSDGSPGFKAHTDSTAADSIDVQLYNGVTTARAVATGGYTGWWAGAIVHASGASTYQCYGWKEGELGFTALTDISPGSQQTPLSYMFLGSQDALDPCSLRVYKFGCFATAPTLAQLDALLRIAAARDGSGDNSWLEQESAAAAGTNEGTSGNFTVNGSPTTSADHPCLPGHADMMAA